VKPILFFALVLGLPGVAGASETYRRADIDSLGQLRIVTSTNRRFAPTRLKGQVGFDKASIAANGRAAGWLALFPNAATSYPIPLALVVLENGRRREFRGEGLPIWRWAFSPDGKQVRFRQETVHGGMGIHYEQRDIATGKLAAQFDPSATRTPPAWVQALDAESAAGDDTLTVVTLNIMHDANDWPSRLNVIVAELRRIRPDVICLQEVLQNPTLPNQAQTLGDSLGCHVLFASVDGPERPKRYGNAVLTPHEVVAESARNLEPADDYRAVGHVRFRWNGWEVDAYSTHLHHTTAGGSIRAAQIRHLLAYVDSTRGDGPTVVAGDFNAELGTPELDLVTARYLDAFRAVHPDASRAEAVTFNARFGVDPGAIDHVFVVPEGARRLVPVATEVIFRTAGPDSVWASDHYGVVAKLRAP
jgi:endonuclease/exonuclease/phosphatase family metal-dependent hydrolase